MTTFREKYKAQVSLPARIAISKQSLERSSLPVVCSEHKSSGVTLSKNKFLVSPGMTIGQFLYYVRKSVSSPCTPAHALFLFVGSEHTIPRVSDAMRDVHEKHKDSDGILYITVCGENTFGCGE